MRSGVDGTPWKPGPPARTTSSITRSCCVRRLSARRARPSRRRPVHPPALAGSNDRGRLRGPQRTVRAPRGRAGPPRDVRRAPATVKERAVLPEATSGYDWRVQTRNIYVDHVVDVEGYTNRGSPTACPRSAARRWLRSCRSVGRVAGRVNSSGRTDWRQPSLGARLGMDRG